MMTNQAILVERRGDDWACAVMTGHPAKTPSFSHYRTITSADAVAAVAQYRRQVPVRKDAAVGVIGDGDFPDQWTVVAADDAAALGAAWDGKQNPSPTLFVEFGNTITVSTAPFVGQAAFAPSFPGAALVFDRLQSVRGFVSREDVVSYGGLVSVYEAIVVCAQVAAPALTAQDIVEHAIADTDVFCSQAVRYVVDAMAAIIGDIALDLGAIGAVVLHGALVDQLRPLIDLNRFEEVCFAKGRASCRLGSVHLKWGLSNGAALRGLAAVMAEKCQYEAEKMAAADVTALDEAWTAMGDRIGWTIDRLLRVVHVRGVAWDDQPSSEVPFRSGTSIKAVLEAMECEGLLPKDTTASIVLTRFESGQDFSFTRFGFGGRPICCSAMAVPNGGYIVTESEAAALNVAPLVSAGAGLEKGGFDEVFLLTQAEEAFDAAISLNPLTEKKNTSQPIARVLIADPNMVARMILKTMLIEDGYEVIFAKDGLDAVRLFEAIKPEIVILDFALGDVGGCDATRRIRALETAWRRKLRALVIGMTDPVDTASCAEGMMAGMDECLPKPFSRFRLSRLIGSWKGEAMGSEVEPSERETAEAFTHDLSRTLGVGG